MAMLTPETAFYFRRFGFCEQQIAAPPMPDLGMVVVIPCFNEPDLVGSLDSLRRCESPACAVEVIVVVNAPADCPEEVRSRHTETVRQAAEWMEQQRGTTCAWHWLSFPNLPPKLAGVG